MASVLSGLRRSGLDLSRSCPVLSPRPQRCWGRSARPCGCRAFSLPHEASWTRGRKGAPAPPPWTPSVGSATSRAPTASSLKEAQTRATGQAAGGERTGNLTSVPVRARGRPTGSDLGGAHSLTFPGTQARGLRTELGGPRRLGPPEDGKDGTTSSCTCKTVAGAGDSLGLPQEFQGAEKTFLGEALTTPPPPCCSGRGEGGSKRWTPAGDRGRPHLSTERDASGPRGSPAPNRLPGRERALPLSPGPPQGWWVQTGGRWGGGTAPSRGSGSRRQGAVLPGVGGWGHRMLGGV